MFLVLLFLTLCLHAVDCPGWQPRTGVMTHGGGGLHDPEPRLLAGRTRCQRRWHMRRYQPRRPPPWGGTRDWTPGPAGGCLYAHSPRGRRGARRWPWVLFEGGVQPGQWRGSPHGNGGLAVQQGAQPPRRCGSPSHRMQPAWQPADSPVPRPPPPGESRGLEGSPGGSIACQRTGSDGGRTSSRHRGALAPTC